MKNDSKKGFVSFIIILIITLVIIIGGFLYFSTKEKMPVKEDPVYKQNEVMKNNNYETTTKYSGTMLAGKSAPLLDFTKIDYDAVVKSDKLVILYFYANWCPICKAEFPVMQGVFDKLTTDKIIGFRVNYNDNETDSDEKSLAREFGVAYQHTKVLLKNGQRILKSPEGWNEIRYNTEINKVIFK